MEELVRDLFGELLGELLDDVFMESELLTELLLLLEVEDVIAVIVLDELDIIFVLFFSFILFGKDINNHPLIIEYITCKIKIKNNPILTKGKLLNAPHIKKKDRCIIKIIR